MTKIASIPKAVTRISWPTVGSVAVGMALFGVVMYAVRRAPTNAVTKPIKQAAAVAGG